MGRVSTVEPASERVPSQLRCSCHSACRAPVSEVKRRGGRGGDEAVDSARQMVGTVVTCTCHAGEPSRCRHAHACARETATRVNPCAAGGAAAESRRHCSHGPWERGGVSSVRPERKPTSVRLVRLPHDTLSFPSFV